MPALRHVGIGVVVHDDDSVADTKGTAAQGAMQENTVSQPCVRLRKAEDIVGGAYSAVHRYRAPTTGWRRLTRPAKRRWRACLVRTGWFHI